MERWLSEVDYTQATGTEDKEQYHLRCSKGDIGKAVIVPGDPGRVEHIVKYLDAPKKLADNRGLVTYTGVYRDTRISVTSTGMGGPSSAIVYEELINIGAEVLIRVGSVAALQDGIEPGDLSIPYGCVRDDGATQYYVPQNFPAVPDPELYSYLVRHAESQGTRFWKGINWTHSAFYSRSQDYFLGWARKRVTTMEMEAATLMTLAYLRGVSAAFIGTVFENRFRQASQERMDLSVPSYKKPEVASGVEASIRIALDAAVDRLTSVQGGK